jgi:NAD(P)-dependent dehydrogenase (short-subunit alcohol dehydrogenase family)
MESYNPFSLKGKTILVTGASSGIGRSIAIESAKMGGCIIITGRNAERLNETFLALEGEGHLQVIADLSKEEDIEALVDVLPKLDGCVCNAGIAKPLLVEFLEKKDIEEVFGINTFSSFLLVKNLLKNKRLNKKSSVVFICSIAGSYCSSVGNSIYSASKNAIRGFIKGFAIEVGKRGIRVNSISPGIIDTELNYGDGVITEDQLNLNLKKHPLRHFGKPEDIAFAVIYLLSDTSEWVTGSDLLIDGGSRLPF